MKIEGLGRYGLAALLVWCGISTASAQTEIPGQQQGKPSVSTASIPLTYVGGDNRVSIGLDQHGNSQGQVMSVFGDNGDHAVVAQLWWQQGGAGGIQADYNWLWGTTLDQVRKDPDSATVAKLSFAIDQNAEKDRQASVGFAIERKEFFLNFFLTGKAGSGHSAGSVVDQTNTVMTGTDEIGNYTQTQTSVATTVLQAQPFSYTVGFQGGHFSDALAARFNGGFDYAKGNQGAHQDRVTFGIDKYIGTRGWSVSGLAEHAQSSDPVNGNRTDNRWWLFLRYEFGGGGAFQPTDKVGNTAWIHRALRTPLTGHPRTVRTYVTRGKTTTTTIPGVKQYTAHRPIVQDDTTTIAEGSGPVTIDVLANDSDPDGNPLSITSVTSPSNGTAQISGNEVVYTPGPSFAGTDQFNYTVSNDKGLSASATVTITVTSTPPPPPPPPPPPSGLVARDDSASTGFDAPVTVDVLANDSDANGYRLSIVSVTAPGHGMAQINMGGNGSITYRPETGYSGTDSFMYSISNGHGASATARVTITVQGLQPIIARDDEASTTYQTPVSIPVVANDSDPNGFFVTVTRVSSPAHGSVSIDSGSRSVTYEPALGFVGTDTFQYTISDGRAAAASASVSVTVLPPSGSFVARNDAATTAYATPVSIDALANDNAPTNLTLTITQVTTPAHGTAQIDNGKITYTPSATFYGGTDTFNYTISDGIGTMTATVNVTVTPPAAPTPLKDSASTPLNTQVTVKVLDNDTDPNGFTLTVTSVATPQHGFTEINPDGSITYTPQADYFGVDTFTYTVSDGHGGTASTNVTITVESPLPPIAVHDSESTPYETLVTFDVLTNDSDPNDLPISIVSHTQPSVGVLTFKSGGVFDYSPPKGFAGNVSFSYTISNGYSTASTTVTIVVQLPQQPILTGFTLDGYCYDNGFECVVCLDNAISNPDSLPITLSTSGTTTLGGTVSAQSDPKCQNQILYTSPDGTFVGQTDTFTATITDPFNRQSTGTIGIPLTTAVDY